MLKSDRGTQSATENRHTNLIQMMICFIGGLCCLLPLYLDPISNLEDSPLRAALESGKSRDSAVASMTLVTPLALDIMTEIFISVIKKGTNSKLQKQNKLILLNTTERLVFLLGIVCIPVTTYFPDNTPKWAYIYVCCQKCQLTLVGGAVFVSLGRYDSDYWSVRKVYFGLTTLATGAVLLSFTANHPTDRTSYKYLRMVSHFIVVLSAAVFFYSCIIWLLMVGRKMMCAYRGRFLKDYQVRHSLYFTFILEYQLLLVQDPNHSR
jgi:hypothetical protein